MGEVERLLEENERLRDALTHFGTYPDAWDALPDRARLELRIEQPASRWAATHVTWRISELKKAKAALIRKNRDDRIFPAESRIGVRAIREQDPQAPDEPNPSDKP
jgi:hypothetical protein